LIFKADQGPALVQRLQVADQIFDV
jgi:hypothetical protein